MWEVIQSIWVQFVGLMRTFQPTDLIDILMVSYLIYKGIQLIRDTRAAQLVKGIVILLVVYAIVTLFQLRMMGYFMINLFQVGLFALIVVFQPELRRALEQLGRSKISNFNLLNITTRSGEDVGAQMLRAVQSVVEGCILLRGMKMGALIVFERSTKLGEIIDTGTVVDAEPTAELVGNIFFNKAPLHDGAMILRDGKIYAAGCILPLTQNASISSELGTRHRAAIGLTEVSDALVIVVSEETGNISVAQNGLLTRNYTKDTLRATLELALIASEPEEDRKHLFSQIKASRKKVEKDGK